MNVLGGGFMDQSQVPSSFQPPPCPDFLFTAYPAVPWAPQLYEDQASYTRAVKKLNAERIRTTAKKCDDDRIDMDVEGVQDQIDHSMDTMIRDSQKRIDTLTSILRDEIIQLIKKNASENTNIPLSESAIAALGTLLDDCNNNSNDIFDRLFEIDSMPEQQLHQILFILVTAAVPNDARYVRCQSVATQLMLPCMLRLSSPPSQSLTAAAHHLGQINPTVLITDCWGALISQKMASLPSTADSFFSHYQAECVCRGIKQGSVPVNDLYKVLNVICSASNRWNDHVLAVLQTVLDAKPPVPLQTVQALTEAFLAAGRRVDKNSINSSNDNHNKTLRLKLAKALLTCVKSYAKELTSGQKNSKGETDVDTCREAAHAIGTFMLKPILQALDKC